jgi:biopolymer transport protein ExbD
MSLLETNNKKFNLPFVFIAGVIFLIGLAYFAKYIEDLSKDAIDLEVPKVDQNVANENSVTIRINKNLEVYLDSVKIDTTQLEDKLKIQFEGQANPTILLQVEEGVSVEKAVNIMDLASKNQYKVILTVRPK